MLKFYLSEDALKESWKVENYRWKSSQSFIEPFNHVALEYFAFKGNSEMIFIVRERLNGYSEQIKLSFPEIGDINTKYFSDIMLEMKEWPLHFMIISLSTTSNNLKVSIKNGRWATAPIFLTVSKQGLVGGWDPIIVCKSMQSKKIDKERLAHFLTAFETPYSAKTIFSDMYMLTEGAVANWESKNKESTSIKIDYPKEIKPPNKKELKPNVDVLSMFEKIMSQSANRWLTPEAHVVSELSSGLDSGVVSAVCSTISNKSINTCGILVPGKEGVIQQERRAEMIEKFGYTDYEIIAENYPPLDADSIRVKKELIMPWEECYYEVTDKLLQECIQPGRTIMYTGVGGDELFFPHWDELDLMEKEDILREVSFEDLKVPAFINKEVIDIYLSSQKSIDRAPRSLIPTSSKEAVAYGAALYLRRGVWPVDPFCSKEIIWFCRSLPENWRKNRILERKFLAKKGCSEKVTFPKITESFTPFMEYSLRKKSDSIIRKAMQNSILNRWGSINSELFLQLYKEYCEGEEMKESTVFFYSTAIMEMTLQCAEV
ncbi:hypothetical protein TOREUM_20458 [Tenacibaculum litoreum]|uniref:hypothetical protein n=1 Tax=Tenacibaculum litoreum TaxID=321269 RepID=UPI0038939C73